jgi:hypothetical protein
MIEFKNFDNAGLTLRHSLFVKSTALTNPQHNNLITSTGFADVMATPSESQLQFCTFSVGGFLNNQGARAKLLSVRQNQATPRVGALTVLAQFGLSE